MRIQVGDFTKHSYRVKDSDLAEFESGPVHNVCSTFALGREIEWTTRQFILEYVDDAWEWVGSYLEISHLSPAMPGELLIFEAEVTKIDAKELLADVVVKSNERLIAKGRTGQRKVDKQRFKENLQRLSEDGEGQG